MGDTIGHFAGLKSDHRRLLAGVVARLDRQFAAHVQIEGRALFPVLTGVTPVARMPVAILSGEHETLWRLLSEIGDLLDAAEEWAVVARGLKK